MIHEGLLKLYWGLMHPITLIPGVRRSYSVEGSGVDYNHVKESAYGATIKRAEPDKNRELEMSSKNLHDTVNSGWDSRGKGVNMLGECCFDAVYMFCVITVHEINRNKKKMI